MSERPQWQTLKELKCNYSSCPVCKADNGVLRYVKQIRDIEMYFYICSECDVLYANPRATVESLKNIYSSKDFFEGSEPGGDNLNYFDFIGGEKYLRMTARSRLSRIKKWCPKGKMLEVASAAGFFLIEAKNAGYDISGIEISVAMAQYAQQRWDVNVNPESIELVDLPQQEFDAIASWGVMTIVQDPIELIRKFHRALKPGGVWAFNTYYHDGLWPRIVKNRWDILVLNFSQIYSRKLLIDIISREGFKLVSRRRDKPHTDLMKIADKLAQNVRMNWLPGLLSKLGMDKIIVKLPLPDVLEYIFQKEDT